MHAKHSWPCKSSGNFSYPRQCGSLLALAQKNAKMHNKHHSRNRGIVSAGLLPFSLKIDDQPKAPDDNPPNEEFVQNDATPQHLALVHVPRSSRHVTCSVQFAVIYLAAGMTFA